MGQKLEHQSEGTNRASYLLKDDPEEAFPGSMEELSKAIINYPPSSVQPGPSPAAPTETPAPAAPVKSA